MTTSTDHGLEDRIRLARSGDLVALSELLEGYRNFLLLTARVAIVKRLQSKVDPADLVQETFLQAHRGFPDFRGQTEFELVAWLRKILAMNVAALMRRYFGTRARDIRLEREIAVEMEESSRTWTIAVLGHESTPSRIASRREQTVLLADALSLLSEDYREAIVLRHFEGLSFAQVAERMGKTVDSVEKLWIRALGKLRAALGERT